MRRLIFYFIVLLIAVWIGLKIQANSGYVLITFKHLTIQTTLWFAALTALITFTVLYFIFRTFGGILSIPKRLKQTLQKHRQTKYLDKTADGLELFLQNDWRHAEKKLVSAIKYNTSRSYTNYMFAAIAAQKQSISERTDNYLLQAQKLVTNKDVTIELLHAKLLMKQHKLEEALSILRRVKQIEPKNKLLLYLLQRIYVELHEWKDLQKILPNLYAEKILSKSELISLERRIYIELINSHKSTDNFDMLEATWNQIPRHFKKDSAVLSSYIDYLLASSTTANKLKAEKILKHKLHRKFDEQLIERYSHIKSSRPIKQLKIAERWLDSNKENTTLLICLGRICKNQKLWGKAKHYLEKALQLKPCALIYNEIADVLEKQGDRQEALEYYRNGIKYLLSNTTIKNHIYD